MARPTFFSSVLSGITGAVKGAIGVGVLGAAAGVIVGVGLGAFAAAGAGTMAAGAVLGAISGGITGVEIGTVLGAITGIVKSRETDPPEAQDIVNLAKISFAQGVSTGRDKRVPEAALDEVEQAVSHKDREDARRALAAAEQKLATRG